MTDPFVELIARLDRGRTGRAELAPPSFVVPAKAAKEIGWGLCTRCLGGVRPGMVVWLHSQPFHAECAVLEELALKAAA